MTGFLPRTARLRQLPVRVPGLRDWIAWRDGLAAATALGLLSVAACTSAPPSRAGATAGATGTSAGITGAATAGAATGATPAARPVAGPSGAATPTWP